MQEFLGGLETPIPLIEKSILDENIKQMVLISEKAQVNLRPHAKTHKLVEIAKEQLSKGAIGITVATLKEAEAFIEAGIKDIRIARPIAGDYNLNKLAQLIDKAKISVIVDSKASVLELLKIKEKLTTPLSVLLKVNVGLNRCGVEPNSEEGRETIAAINDTPHIFFDGLLTHAGHAYAASTQEEIIKIGLEEGTKLVNYAANLKEQGIEVKEISVGSTPTVFYSAFVGGVTEIRPGNFVFFDANQVALGVIPITRCALTILTTIISKPSEERLIIDAGTKALGLDKGAHGSGLLKGYGIICDVNNSPLQGLILSRLSEEHGVIEVKKTGSNLKVGDKLRIIPNHACAAINYYSYVNVLLGHEKIDKWIIVAKR